jgi:hypothetical protein
MKPWLSVFVAALGACLVIAALVWPRTGEPRFVPKNLELGAQALGRLVRCEALIPNRSSRPLLLGRPESSCGIHRVDLSTDSIAPGADVRVEVTLEIGAVEKFLKTVSVPFLQGTDDAKPASGTIVLRITGEGVAIPLVNPPLVPLGGGSSGGWREFSVRYCPGPPVDLPQVVASVGEGEIRVRSTQPVFGGYYKVDLAYRATGVSRYGHLRTPLRLCLASNRDSVASSELAFEHVPRGMEGRWPKCLVVIPSPSAAQQRLLFPDTRISGCDVVEGDVPSWIRVELGHDSAGSTLTIFPLASRGAPRSMSVFTVKLVGEPDGIHVRVVAVHPGS